jgi:hypothetical protein
MQPRDTGSMDSNETRPVTPSSARPARRLISLLVRIVAGVTGLGIIAFGVFLVLFITHYGDEAPPRGVVVVNRTPIDLNIYVYVPGQEPVLSVDVPAHSRVATGITCGARKMTAKDAAGHVIARRGPFPSCNESEWAISATPSPNPSSSGGG